ncbi:MAG: SHOCT domain-containing protein [Candidatus Parvarchaeum sp.]
MLPKSVNKFYYVLFGVVLSILIILPSVSHAAGTSTPYDEQLGMTLIQNYTALGYNVTAVAQTSGTSGTGPAYLLNGYSNTGYWYQVGLSWNWATLYGNSPNQFLLSYEVFAPNGTSIYPTGGGTGLLTLSGPVNEGDIVLLNLYFKNNTVIFLVKDWNTGASAYTTFPAYGATEFVGNPYSTSTNGFFTGLMTEWYGTNANFPIQQTVTYSPYGTITSPVWLWGDEFSCVQPCYQKNAILNNVSSTYFYPTSSHYLTLTAGSTEEYTSGAVFITGATPPPIFHLLSANIKNIDIDEGRTLYYPINISVSGGTPPYTYSVNIKGLPNLVTPIISSNESETMYIDVATSCIKSYSNSSLICSMTPGIYYYNVTVTDGNGYTVSSSNGQIQLNNPPQITLNSNKTTIDAGQKISINYNINGGIPPFNVSYFVNGQNVGSTLTIPNTGNYSVYARVTDSDGFVANSSQINFRVNSKPIISINSNRTTADVGSSILLTSNASGGTPPYIYKWYVNNQLMGSSRSFTFSPATSGQYNIHATLIDSANYSLNSTSLVLVINTKPSIASFKLLPSSSLLYINNTVNGAISLSGGTPPYTYRWYLNGVLQPNSNSSSYVLNLDRTGVYNISVTAQDATGQSATNSQTIQVNLNLEGIIGRVVIAIIIVIAAVSYFVIRSKKNTRHKIYTKRKTSLIDQEQDPLKTLKVRYAKGELTKKQYEKMRKDLE